MNTIIFEGVITALTSVSHIGESHGVNAKLRREKLIQPDGSVEQVPIISGNALRGILRDRGMFHMLKTLGYGINIETGEVQGLSLSAFYFLFSGGALTKAAGIGLDIDQARRWRELIPLVGLFGGAMGNQIMPGKAKVGKAIPICRETAHLIPEHFISGDLQSIWDVCQEEAYTRRDDEKNENLRQLIAPEVRAYLEQKASEKRERELFGDDLATQTGQHQQMRYYVETIAAGTRFFWDIVLDDPTEIERDAFFVTLSEFSRQPYIGGKSNVGHGKISIRFDKWLEIEPRVASQGSDVSFGIGAAYLEHLTNRANEIRELIHELA